MLTQGEGAVGVAFRVRVEIAIVAIEVCVIEGVHPVWIEVLSDLPVVAGDFALGGTRETVVGVRSAGGVGTVVANARRKDGAIWLAGRVRDLDANKVHQGFDDAGFRSDAGRERKLGLTAGAYDGALVDFGLEYRKAVNDAVASELVVDDRQVALFEGTDAHVGRFEIRPGKEHSSSKPVRR